ncbi:MAG: hypothetical protein RL653_1917 [Pseudomonadota bacterium]|jgi:23S rRNA pseudouridine1911/1915/1917 synthase
MSADTVKELAVAQSHEGQRVDLVVKEALGLSRALVKQLFDEDRVRLDGRLVKKGLAARAGQVLRVTLPEAQPRAAVADDSFALDILSEDDVLVFADKPAHRPSHPLQPGETGTVANALVARYPEMADASEDPREGGLCHRLDVETSGVILGARTRTAWTALRQAFGTRGGVDKRYWALVSGPIADEGEIDLPLRHHPRHPDRVEADPSGGPGARDAVSEFKVLARAGELSLVEVKILTGVLHQVRAHLASVGAPLVGDALYGGRSWPGLDRFFLHARSLAVTHPGTGAPVQAAAPLPPELRRVLEEAGISAQA